MVEFSAVDKDRGIGDGWLFDVRIEGVLVGRIRRDPEIFRYYRVFRRDVAPFHEARQLDTLLERVIERP